MKRTRPKTEKIKTTMDRSRVIFDGDRDLRKQLKESRHLAKFWRELEELGPSPDSRVDLLRRAVRLTPGLAPGLFRSIERCKKTLGLTAEIDVFCRQDAIINAFVLPARGGRITMGFTHAIIESLDEDEMCSVIGHELGHVLFEHHDLKPLLIFEDDDRMALVDVLRLYAWNRYAELTADRVGLLCCGSIESAIFTEFKVSSGLSDPRMLGDVQGFIAQYASLKQEAIEDDTDDWTSTHPLAPLRVKALELFYRSKTFQNLTGKGPGDLSEAEMEREVTSLMSLMNPSILDDKGTGVREKREFLVYGGMAVARADDKVAKKELDAIKQLVGEGGILDKLDEAADMTSEQLDAKLGELGSALILKLSKLQKRKLVEELCLIALADRHVEAPERQMLAQFASNFGLEDSYVDEVLDRPTKVLD